MIVPSWDRDPRSAQPLPSSPRHIFIIRAGALGDVILTIPAIRSLRKRFPNARITAAGYPDTWSVADPLVDEVLSIDSPLLAGLYTDSPDTPLLHRLRDVDLIIAWTAQDPYRALARVGRSVVHASPHPPPGVHAAAWLLRTLDLSDRLPPTLGLQHLIVQGQTLLRDASRSIFIHPGAGAVWKRWPAECFALVADALVEEGFSIRIVEGPADETSVQALLDHARHAHRIVHTPSIRDLAATLRCGALFIGNDSGVTHLAAGLGLSTIAIFGPTDPVQWQPIGNVAVLRGCVRVAATQGHIRVCDDPHCLQSVSVEDVLLAAHTKTDGI